MWILRAKKRAATTPLGNADDLIAVDVDGEAPPALGRLPCRRVHAWNARGFVVCGKKVVIGSRRQRLAVPALAPPAATTHDAGYVSPEDFIGLAGLVERLFPGFITTISRDMDRHHKHLVDDVALVGRKTYLRLKKTKRGLPSW